MQRSVGRCLRWKLPFVGKAEDPKAEAMKGLTKEQREKLRSMKGSLVVEKKEEDTKWPRQQYADHSLASADEQAREDAVRARGVAKYTYNYAPPSNVQQLVQEEAKRVLSAEGEQVADEGSLLSFSFGGKNAAKFKVLMSIADRLHTSAPSAFSPAPTDVLLHLPLSGRLYALKTVQDIVDFYAEPTANTSPYVRMARDARKPENMTMMEQAQRFHPEDKEAWHGGVTAFPGSGGRVLGLRNQRLLRQFKPKEKWFDYEDQAFDYSRPDERMPWDPEMIKKMDSAANKRYNLRTKSFDRTDKQKGLHMEE